MNDPTPSLQSIPVKWEGDPADEAEVENDRFRCWEAGFKAGLEAANGGHPTNPYQWHYVAKS